MPPPGYGLDLPPPKKGGKLFLILPNKSLSVKYAGPCTPLFAFFHTEKRKKPPHEIKCGGLRQWFWHAKGRVQCTRPVRPKLS